MSSHANLVARADDTDDVRWALQAALSQLKQGGQADAIVWVKRAAEAAEAAGNAQRGAELRAQARQLAEAMWNLPSSGGAPASAPPSSSSIEIEIDVEMEEIPSGSTRPPPPGFSPPGFPPAGGPPGFSGSGRPPPLRPPPGARGFSDKPPRVTAAPLVAPTVMGFAAPDIERTSLSETSPYRSSVPELEARELDADPLFASGMPSDSQRPSGAGRITGVNPLVSSAPAFNDRLSSVDIQPMSVDSVIPSFQGLPGDMRPVTVPPAPESVRRALALIDDEEILAEDEDERVTQDFGFLGAEGRLQSVYPKPSQGAAQRGSLAPRGAGSSAPGAAPDSQRYADSQRGAMLPPTSPPPLPSRSPAGAGPASVRPASVPPGSVAPPSVRPASMPPASMPPQSVRPLSATPPSGIPRSMPPLSIPPNATPPSGIPRSMPPASMPPASIRAGSLPPGSLPPGSLPPGNAGPLSLPPNSTPPSGIPRSVSPASAPPASVPPSSNRAPTSGSPASLGPLSPAPPSRPSFGAPPEPFLRTPSSRPPEVQRFSRRAPPSLADALGFDLGELTLEVSDLGPPEGSRSLPPGMPEQAEEGARQSRTSVRTGAGTAATRVDGIPLEELRGFEDLPVEVQQGLARSVRIQPLDAGDEVGFFGAAVVTAGSVDILPAISDDSGAVADTADVVFTRGSLPDAIALRVVAKIDGTRVATWDPDVFEAAIAPCPWLHDELRFIADYFVAVCGAALGPLGERLDPALRTAVFKRLEVRALQPGEVLLKQGAPIASLFVVGGGRLLVERSPTTEPDELLPGGFVFADKMMSAKAAPATVVAGDQGALVLYAPRSVAHELMMSVPPLLEVLAG